MDTSGSFVYNLQPDQFPVDQGTEQHQSQQHQQDRYITKRTTISPSVSHGMLQDDLYRCDPCPSSVENWAGSSSGSVISAQHPWGLGTLSQRFTLSPSSSPQTLSPPSGGNVHPLSFYDADHLFYHHDTANVSPSMTTKPDPSPIKLEAFSPLEGYHDSSSSSDWTCDVDFDVPSGFEPESFCAPLDIPTSLEPSVLTNTSSSSASVSSKTTTTTTPTLSPPTLTGSSCDQQSPTNVKIEPAREDLPSYPADNVHVPCEDQNAESPYSKLIEQALLSTPDKKLPLQGIYGWFEKNTAKGREGSKGWQNSIRHNLSMNAGFVAIRESPNGKKSVNLWRLTDEAIKKGIQSTTRYRKQANQEKDLGSEPPAPQRQRSGAKGGKVTKITTKFRGPSNADELLPAQSRSQSRSAVPSLAARQRHRQRQRQQLRQRQLEHEQEQEQREEPEREREQEQQPKQESEEEDELLLPPNELYSERYVPCPTTAMPAFPEPDPAASIEGFDFNLSNVDDGCTDASWDPPVFSSMGGGSECLSLDLGLCSGMYQPPNGLPNELPHYSGWLTPEISTDLPLGV